MSQICPHCGQGFKRLASHEYRCKQKTPVQSPLPPSFSSPSRSSTSSPSSSFYRGQATGGFPSLPRPAQVSHPPYQPQTQTTQRCPDCGRSLKNLANHKICHGRKLEARPFRPADVPTRPIEPANAQLQICPDCGQGFKNLANHKICHGRKPEARPFRTPDVPTRPMEPAHAQLQICPDCGKGFKNLVYHKICHGRKHGTKPVKPVKVIMHACPDCGKYFKNLANHKICNGGKSKTGAVKTVSVKMQICPDCGKYFKNLARHKICHGRETRMVKVEKSGPGQRKTEEESLLHLMTPPPSPGTYDTGSFPPSAGASYGYTGFEDYQHPFPATPPYTPPGLQHQHPTEECDEEEEGVWVDDESDEEGVYLPEESAAGIEEEGEDVVEEEEGEDEDDEDEENISDDEEGAVGADEEDDDETEEQRSMSNFPHDRDRHEPTCESKTRTQRDRLYPQDADHIPSHTPKPAPIPIDLEDVPRVVFDMETTGFGVEAHIIQLAASHDSNTFSTYVLPGKPITKSAEQVTGISVRDGIMFKFDTPVTAVPIRRAITLFFDFLRSMNNPAVLMGHNSRLFDSRILINTITKCDMMDDFREYIAGFVDTLPLMKELYPNRKSYKQFDLHVDVMGEAYDAHDAESDVVALRDLLAGSTISQELWEKYSFSAKYVTDILAYLQMKKALMDTLYPLTGTVSEGMRAKMAGSGLGMQHLRLAFLRGGRDGLADLLREDVGGKPRISKSKRFIGIVCDFFARNHDP